MGCAEFGQAARGAAQQALPGSSRASQPSQPRVVPSPQRQAGEQRPSGPQLQVGPQVQAGPQAQVLLIGVLLLR